MSLTIPQSFQKLKENLQITGLQESIVSTRQSAVRKVAESDLKVLDSFLTGSYARDTMIAPLKEADIDIFMVLGNDYFYHYNGQNGGQAGLLDLVKRTLKKTYTRTPDISRNGQAVTIRFEDFVVDAVPGFHRQGGGYLIPNSTTQTWISTDPKLHVQIISNANKTHSENFIPLIKMIKAWNKSHSGYFRSFHLEVLALQILNNVTISDFPSGLRYFFDKGRTLVAQQSLDPAGYGGNIGSYLNTTDKINEAKTRFQLAYERAIKAEGYQLRGSPREAIEMWIKVLGAYFPAYG